MPVVAGREENMVFQLFFGERFFYVGHTPPRRPSPPYPCVHLLG